MIDAKKFATDNLEAFKARMRITTDDEQEMKNLTSMLISSVKAVATLVGADEESDELTELTFERARYLYHDALDEWRGNYADEIEFLYMSYRLKVGTKNDEKEND